MRMKLGRWQLIETMYLNHQRISMVVDRRVRSFGQFMVVHVYWNGDVKTRDYLSVCIEVVACDPLQSAPRSYFQSGRPTKALIL